MKSVKKKTKKNLTFSNNDILKEKNKYFDIALIIDVIEHVEDYFYFLRKVKKKANYKIFHIPLDLSVLNASLNVFLFDSETFALESKD